MGNVRISSIESLPSDQRYAFLVRGVAECEEIWGAWSAAGWAMLGDKTEQAIFPVWSEECFAASWIERKKGGEVPKRISLSDFLEKWIPGLSKDGIRIAAFPVAGSSVSIVMPEALSADLVAESEQYE